jgi:primosomal protein N' (replication factor Y) (superfamily II helicase)
LTHLKLFSAPQARKGVSQKQDFPQSYPQVWPLTDVTGCVVPLVAVALPTPLDRLFDYRWPEHWPAPRPGQRLRVSFGRRTLIGLAVADLRLQALSAEEAGRYKPVLEALDADAPLPAEWLDALRWAADYYRHPLGNVIATALPARLRAGADAAVRSDWQFVLTSAGQQALATLPARATALRALLGAAANGPVAAHGGGAPLKKALQQGWLQSTAVPTTTPPVPSLAGPALTDEQRAVWQPLEATQGFGVTLIEGVTGSGKTELYLRKVEQVIRSGAQALVLVPEIGLSPQLVTRFVERFGANVVESHSGMGEAARLNSWLAMRDGNARVMVGTRSAVFTPFARLGLVVIDEEHDGSYKQQDGFRYHARDFAIRRAQMAGAPVLLGSATPSLESLANAEAGRYHHLRLARRVRGEAPPQPQLINLHHYPAREGLSEPLAAAVERHVQAGGQALLFINRRGFAPTLYCDQCHWQAPCPHCAGRLTVHRASGRLQCHHCGYGCAIPRECPSCGGRTLRALGEGTERIEETLKNRLPGHRVERFDAERFSSDRALAALLDDVRQRRVSVLVGTQMLAKGHDFGALSLVGVVNADAALHSADFRATERLAQLLTQVAGRAGRSAASLKPEVLIQTREPDHPLLRALLQHGYGTVARQLLAERRAAGLPPAAHLALLRAESGDADDAQAFLVAARDAFPADAGVERLGPAPALLARRAGRYRYQLMLLAAQRRTLRRCLPDWQRALETLPLARRVRYSLDIDPADLG